MREKIKLSAGVLLVGCLVAACSGGGSSTLPSTAPHGTTPQRAQSVAFTITIPPARTTSSRSAQYISASTQSVSIVETDGTATPSPAVVQNTTPGSAGCTTSATSGTTCTINVNANPGADAFLVTAYDKQNGTGNVLSTGTVHGTVVAGQANSFALTLNGSIASFTLIASDAYPQVGTKTSISAQAKDAGGNIIVGAYDTPIALSASGNATLSTAQLASSGDTSSLALNAAQTASFTVGGVSGTHTGTVTINPSSGIVYYPLGSGATTDAQGFHVITGNDGKLYYTTLGLLQCTQGGFCYGNSGALGQFDPSTGSFTEIPLPQDEPVAPYQTADGTVWVSLTSTDAATTHASGYVGYVKGTFGASNLTQVPLPTPSPYVPSRPRSFALDKTGANLYLTGNQDHRIYQIPLSNPAGATAIPLPSSTAPPGALMPFPSPAFPQGVTLGTDGNLYIANNSTTAPNVMQYDGSAFTPFALPGVAQSQAPRYIVTGSDANLYESSAGTCAVMPCGGALNAITTAGVFTPIALPDGYSWPDDLAVGNGFVAFADLGEAGIGTYDFTSKEVRDYPIEPATGQVACCSVWTAPQGVTVGSDGSLWYTTYGTLSKGGPVGMAHVVMTSNWSVWPTKQISLYGAGPQSAQLIGVMESGNSGPFTLTSSNPNVAVLQPIPGESHDFHLLGVGGGSCTVTITDKNGRSETIAVSVTTTSGTVQSTRRRTPDASTAGGLF